MRLSLNYIITVISDCTHSYHTNTFTHNLTRVHLLQLKIHNIWMKFFWNQKVFHLAIKEISTLKSLYKLFLIKLSADISDSSFVLDSLSKAKTFPNFSAGNSFLFFNRFQNVGFSERCNRLYIKYEGVMGAAERFCRVMKYFSIDGPWNIFGIFLMAYKIYFYVLS